MTTKSTTFTKNNLVKSLSKKHDINALKVAALLEDALGTITDALAEGQKIEFRNFGVLSVRTNKPRIGRNPKNPTVPVTIPARKVAKFKAGKILKAKLSA